MIEIIDVNDDRWDDLVEGIDEYYAYYKRKYIRAITRMDNAEPILFSYSDENGVALSVCMKHDLANNKCFIGRIEHNKYFDLISPYGYGGYVFCDCDPRRVAAEHREVCRAEKNFVSEVIKFHPLSRFVDSYEGKVSSPFHNVIRSTDGSMDDIWMDFKQKVRKNVKKAISYDLQVFHEATAEHLDDFINIYYKTMERNNADKAFFFDRSFFDLLSSDEKNIEFFYVVKGNRVISAELVLYDNYCAYSYLGGTDDDFFEMRPNDILKYEIIRWANQKGLRSFILGGGHGDDDGIFNYKAALAPKGVVDFYIGTDLFSKEKYDELCQLRKDVDASFSIDDRLFPAYRF